MNFGRPAMTTHAQNVLLPSEDVDGSAEALEPGHPSRMAFFIESIRLSTVLEKVLDKIYQPWRDKSGSDAPHPRRPYCTNLDTVTELDSELAEFEASLPPFLSWKETRTIETAASDSLISMQRNILRGR